MAGLSITEKIIKDHLIAGEMKPGEQITIKICQCLLQDATGTMTWLEFEAIGVEKVKPFTVQYIDPNLLQTDNKNMEDHLFLMTIGTKHGAYVSLPGNRISHHVHKERFTKPGQTLVGADSHTPTASGSGMLAIGIGGMEAAVAMATGEFTFTMPKIVGVNGRAAQEQYTTKYFYPAPRQQRQPRSKEKLPTTVIRGLNFQKSNLQRNISLMIT